eukprot:4093146-Prymnesium_polylepis.1
MRSGRAPRNADVIRPRSTSWKLGQDGARRTCRQEAKGGQAGLGGMAVPCPYGTRRQLECERAPLAGRC